MEVAAYRLLLFGATTMVMHPLNVRNAICNFICSLLNGGELVLQSATGVTVATLRFADPAFAPAIDGVAVANSISSDPNSIGGIVARASMRDSNDNEVLRCDVTLPGLGGMIELSTLTVAAGQEVGITALTYTSVP